MLKLNLGSGANPLPGFTNLDLPDWRWADGLVGFKDGEVAGITISHALMYASEVMWPFIFKEIYRVLAPDGVVRITEDATDDPASDRLGGFPGYKTLTSASKVRQYLERAGFDEVVTVGPDETIEPTLRLQQQFHGAPPKVFFIEGRK